MEVRGYKVFNSDWTCSPGGNTKQYSCPGDFVEDVTPVQCSQGMHFCRKAIDCFNYYSFDPNNKVAEVVGYGEVVEEGDKCCTNKLKIVREVSWQDLLELVNTGMGCTGKGNSGDCNSGNRNSGDRNSGDRNSGDCNSGNRNSGDRNSGNWNSGDCNSGDWNSGNWNSGDCNSGDWNSGDWNSGNCNSGDRNSGDCNSGNRNSGDRNSGDCNSGNRNSGDRNSGDWNKCNFSNGCFNTIEPNIYLFNKPSKWSYRDWMDSNARYILNQIPFSYLKWVYWDDMTDEERKDHPEAESTGGYLKTVNEGDCMVWWHGLTEDKRSVIKSIPNFDREIFKEITGIDVAE